MANETDYQQLLDRLAALREGLTNRFASDLITNPQLADALMKQIDDLFLAAVKQDQETTPPPDKGLAQLAGVGPDAADQFGKTRIPQGVEPYDEQITSERIVAVGDLYYIYQHEKIGVFRVIRKLKELFHAGAVRLSSGDGAFRLYQFDRRDVLRYTRNDRLMAYRRAFGYGNAPVPQGTTPVKNLFGTDNAWDTVEEILVRYFNERLVTSPRQRMGVAGREVLRWLAQPHIMKMQRGEFEALLLEIAEFAEEWLTSAQSLGLARRMEANRVMPWGSDVTGVAPSFAAARRTEIRRRRNGAAAMGRA